MCNVSRQRAPAGPDSAGNPLAADPLQLPAAACQTEVMHASPAALTAAPALLGIGFGCKDSTRAIIEELLQKDRDLEAAQSQIQSMHEHVRVVTAKSDAQEATNGQLTTQVLITSPVLQSLFYAEDLRR